MSNFYVPYNQNHIASVEINGHTLVIVTEHADDFEHSIYLDTDNTKLVNDIAPEVSEDFGEENEYGLSVLSDKLGASVIVAPPDVPVDILIENLEDQLPWIQ